MNTEFPFVFGLASISAVIITFFVFFTDLAKGFNIYSYFLVLLLIPIILAFLLAHLPRRRKDFVLSSFLVVYFIVSTIFYFSYLSDNFFAPVLFSFAILFSLFTIMYGLVISK